MKKITGRPDPEHISTSYVERQTLTMRMGMRRFTGSPTRSAQGRQLGRSGVAALYVPGWHRTTTTLLVDRRVER